MSFSDLNIIEELFQFGLEVAVAFLQNVPFEEQGG